MAYSSRLPGRKLIHPAFEDDIAPKTPSGKACFCGDALLLAFLADRLAVIDNLGRHYFANLQAHFAKRVPISATLRERST